MSRTQQEWIEFTKKLTESSTRPILKEEEILEKLQKELSDSLQQYQLKHQAAMNEMKDSVEIKFVSYTNNQGKLDNQVKQQLDLIKVRSISTIASHIVSRSVSPF